MSEYKTNSYVKARPKQEIVNQQICLICLTPIDKVITPVSDNENIVTCQSCSDSIKKELKKPKPVEDKN
jgi:hypothetical protein